jgi:hypothetical protein
MPRPDAERVTVASLRRALSDWKDDAEVYVQACTGSIVAIVAIMPEDVDVQRGRFSQDEHIVVLTERIS